MATRMNPDRLEVSEPDVAVIKDTLSVHHAPTVTVDEDQEAGSTGTHPVSTSRRPLLWLALVAVVILLAAAAMFAVMRGGDSNVVVEPRNADAGTSGVASPKLKITVEPPATVTAGKPATFTVNYEAAQGVFDGSIEEWGDGVGASSVGQARCDGAAAEAAPLEGRYDVTHTWDKAGTYRVLLGVTTHSCVKGQPREATASRSLTVTVAAP